MLNFFFFCLVVVLKYGRSEWRAVSSFDCDDWGSTSDSWARWWRWIVTESLCIGHPRGHFAETWVDMCVFVCIRVRQASVKTNWTCLESSRVIWWYILEDDCLCCVDFCTAHIKDWPNVQIKEVIKTSVLPPLIFFPLAQNIACAACAKETSVPVSRD